jgi:hypothetical protein
MTIVINLAFMVFKLVYASLLMTLSLICRLVSYLT